MTLSVTALTLYLPTLTGFLSVHSSEPCKEYSYSTPLKNAEAAVGA